MILYHSNAIFCMDVIYVAYKRAYLAKKHELICVDLKYRTKHCIKVKYLFINYRDHNHHFWTYESMAHMVKMN